MKLLHVVENLDRGAVENCLVNVFLGSRRYRPEWRWCFYCLLGKEGGRPLRSRFDRALDGGQAP
jgi:hypothetical protein